jgi:hypothetical protein
MQDKAIKSTDSRVLLPTLKLLLIQSECINLRHKVGNSSTVQFESIVLSEKLRTL